MGLVMGCNLICEFVPALLGLRDDGLLIMCYREVDTGD